MTSRRLLVVAYTFPPMPTVGANRWDAMARHLRLLGHDVTVVSTAAFGLMRDPAEECHVRRASDLTANQWLRRAFRRGPVLTPSDVPTVEREIALVEKPLPPLLQKILVPDPTVAMWLPQAMRLAQKVVAERQIECVITSSPYESVHLLGLRLRSRNVAWVADFRDGWLFEPLRPAFPTRAQRKLDEWLEQRVARNADAVVAATKPIADDFRWRLNVDAVHITNGFDPLRYRSLPRVDLPQLPDGSITLVYTGRLAGLANRDPRGLFHALAKLREHEPLLASRLRLLLAGRLDSEEVRLVADSRLDDGVVVLGELPHAECVALQRRADALLLLTSADGAEATGKLFEYLSSGRPILALAGSTVARIVSDTRTGVTVAPDDVDAIYEQVKRLAAGKLPPYAPTSLDEYRYPAPAQRMSNEIERAIARRSPQPVTVG